MKNWLLAVFFLFLIPFSLAENLYQYDSLKLKLGLEGGFELVSKSSYGRVEEVVAEMRLYPQNDFQQEVLYWESTGEVKDGQVYFSWKEPVFGHKSFGYEATIKTKNERQEVREKIPFPIKNLSGYEEYLQPTETIDSDNPDITAKAAELAEGEDDLFRVVFKIARWVEENVAYDLNTLTATASQKASWVMEHREGVCDEMTSLFVAMARSLGIPARFVSGISYTTSELFTEKWQPHGWAEVYFPNTGWVGFDIAFGEYGYVDVTHIKLRHGFDPQEPATEYQWLAEKVDLKSRDLKLKVELQEKGRVAPEEIFLEGEILAPKVGLGSYNLVRGRLRNKADYYLAASLQLAVPAEIEIIGDNKRTLLLTPLEEKETFWLIRVKNDLDPHYTYTFPVAIYTEKNLSRPDQFVAQEGKKVYSRQEVEGLMVEDEDKSYSRQISFACDFPKKVSLGEEKELKCTIKNEGNTNLKGIDFCLAEVCEIIDLLINQKKSASIKIRGETTGWKSLVVSAENDNLEKKVFLEYAVLDSPSLEAWPQFPEEVNYGNNFQINILLKKKSFSDPQQVKVHLRGMRMENVWEIEEWGGDQNLTLELSGRRLSPKNRFVVSVSWEDEAGKAFTNEQEIVLRGKASSFPQKWRMFLNRMLLWLKS